MSEKQSKDSNGRGGRRSGAGRKAGIHNKASIARQAEVAASGQTPLDYLLQVMRTGETSSERLDAAKAAAPYVHPKLASVEHKGETSLSVTIKQY